ncbi:unnamed protein product [Heligmosomoides polygyrus]|uniref:Uncharacterized protein n=1 Tax=Heligmosomoides polygyrus TaxID=6339 RepID=A0A183FDX5_HELPZ|nr:unnamed protein product [Heligmosomoides polygyrus]
MYTRLRTAQVFCGGDQGGGGDGDGAVGDPNGFPSRKDEMQSRPESIWRTEIRESSVVWTRDGDRHEPKKDKASTTTTRRKLLKGRKKRKQKRRRSNTERHSRQMRPAAADVFGRDETPRFSNPRRVQNETTAMTTTTTTSRDPPGCRSGCGRPIMRASSMCPSRETPPLCSAKLIFRHSTVSLLRTLFVLRSPSVELLLLLLAAV